MFRTLFLTLTLLTLSGCKLAVIVVEGGEVNTPSGHCLAGEVCIETVTDTNYSAVFRAIPDAGWHFVKWNSGDSFLCKNSANRFCSVSNIAGAGNSVVEAIVASDTAVYLMPIFKEGLATVVADGKEWAQPIQLGALSWDEISAACPAGVCTGVLNGYDMTGWTWATVDDMNSLFNSYIGTPELGPGPDSTSDSTPPLEWAAQMYSEGWQNSYYDPGYYQGIYAWTATHAGSGTAYTASLLVTSANDSAWLNTSRTENTDFVLPVFLPSPFYGGWFYR